MHSKRDRRVRKIDLDAGQRKAWGGKVSQTAIAGIMCFAILSGPIFGCARNPVTGRPEPVFTTERGEISQGHEAAKYVEEEFGLVKDADLEAYVNQLGQRLAIHSPRTNIKYHFYVVDMIEPNAFALPGGHIYVSRGLLALPNSEAELAAVIGHEIGHVAARHAVQRQTASTPLIPLQIASAVGGAATAIVSPRLGQIVRDAGQLPGAFALAAYSREQEQQADELGQQIAADAGYDPVALAGFLHTLALEEKLSGESSQRTSFFRTHPPSPRRIADAEKYGRDLTPAKNQPPALSRRAFLQNFDGILVGEDPASGVFLDDEFIHPALGIGFSIPPTWKRINTPEAVIAQDQDGHTQVNLMISGRGSDLMREFIALKKTVSLEGPPQSLKISGLDALQAMTERKGRNGNMKILITWIAYDNLIYRMIGATKVNDFESQRALLEETTQSFHRLSQEQRDSVVEKRLRLVSAQPAETLETLGERNQNAWGIKQTAIVNAMHPQSKIQPGRLIKIARPEKYVPKTKSEEPDEL